MRRGDDLRIANANQTVRAVFATTHQIGRRTGAVMLVDDHGLLVGLFTDSDLARMFEQRRDQAFDKPIREVMTHYPKTISQSARLSEAVRLFTEFKISELPVVDEAHHPVGLLDVTDLIGVQLAEAPTQAPSIRLLHEGA
jgi:arabinose-5-phosphate isomerase